MGKALGKSFGVLGGHQVPGLAVSDRELDPADIGADHRRPARHGLEWRDAEGLVPGRGDEHVGGAVVELQRVPSPAAGQHDGVRHPLGPGDLLQAADLGGPLRVGLVALPADDDEEGRDAVIPHQACEAPHDVVRSLPGHQAPEVQHDGPVRRQPEMRPGEPLRHWPQLPGIDAPRDDGLGLFPTRSNVGRKAEFTQDITHLIVVVALVETHPLRLLLRGHGTLEDDALDGRA